MAFYYQEGSFSFYREERSGWVCLYKVHTESGVIVETTVL